jgi:hypothetical protein
MKKKNVIEIQEETHIEQDNETIILEKGDKIEVLNEATSVKASQIVWDAIEEFAYQGGNIKDLRSAVAGGIDIVWGDEAIDEFFRSYI